MDLGLIGMEGMVNQQQESESTEQDGKRKCGGSGSGSTEEDATSRISKVARNCHDLGVSGAAMGLQQQGMFAPLMKSSDPQMLSFASPRSEVSFVSASKDGGDHRSAQSLTWSCYQHSPAPAYSRNAGYASGSIHGSLTGIRGPFTPAQWIELEHQALIYKYFTANVPVPATLLVPISRAFNPSGFSGFPAGSFPAHSYGWGHFHLGYSGSNDPEPGRCRRTDGKKWRCSRDAVPDQKYCERHINRGRHRSRKPVEGQSGQAASGPTNPKVNPMSSSMSSPLTPGGCAANSLAIPPHQLKGLQAGASNLVTDPAVNRLQDSQGPSVMPAILNLKSKDPPFSIPKQQCPFEESPQSEFGFVSTESLLNPSSRNSYLSSKNYNSLLDFNDQQSQDQNPVRHFIDDWPPKDHSNRSNLTWPEEMKSDWTQLSMSIPMSNFSSSSANQEKIALASLRLSRELDQTQMGLGVGSATNEAATKHGNWIPISWGNSMGDPLGEVLNNAGNGVGSCRSTSALNLTGEGWDGSPQTGSSPTGVLQKGAFVSLSSSGSGSSPRAENKNVQEGARLYDDLLAVSAHAASSSIPAL